MALRTQIMKFTKQPKTKSQVHLYKGIQLKNSTFRLERFSLYFDKIVLVKPPGYFLVPLLNRKCQQYHSINILVKTPSHHHIIPTQNTMQPEMSETLVLRLRLRPGWSQGRSQALRPPAKSLSISLKIHLSIGSNHVNHMLN